MSDFFYKPEGAWAADFIPFYAKNKFQLFYLHDWRNPEKNGEGTPWFLLSTKDLVHFTEHGEVLPRGRKDEQDLYVFTGSVIEAQGRYHIFYTGHNGHFPKENKPMEAVMHAVSDDLLHWTKIPEDTFYSSGEKYERDDWRDPFVFWNDEANEYWMLLAARLKTGPSRRRGCTALRASKDLKKWEVRDPFWSPGLYYTHECPDLFKIGKWWYLLYSTFTERFATHYRMSRSLKGPWLSPENDLLDGRGFYAAKTASDGKRRYAFGWNATRDQEKDDQYWMWGSNLVVHEIVQERDGTLSVKVPAAVDKAFAQKAPVQFATGFGPFKAKGRTVTIDRPDGFACAAAGELPSRGKIQAKITFTKNTRGCGIMLKVSEDLEQAYYVRLEPRRNRLVFDMWPRAADKQFMIELERPIDLKPNRPIELKIIIDGTICEVYAGDRVAMSARMYNLKTGRWGVFVNEGSAKFETNLFLQK